MIWLEFPRSPALYGAFVSSGAAVAGWTYRRWKPQLPLPREVAQQYYGALFAGAALGAYSVEPLHLLLGHPGVTGHSVMTALFFAWITAEVMKRCIGLRQPTGDPLAIGLAAALCIGRIGCLFGHCCLGEPYSGPFALVDGGAPRFPAPLLEAAFHGLACLLLWRATKMNRWSGSRLRLYVASYCVFRFLSESFRGYVPVGLGLSLYQWLAAILFVIVSAQLAGQWRASKRGVPG